MSGGAVPGGRDGTDVLGDLEFLSHHRGEAYSISATGGGYTAIRRDGKGGTLAAADPVSRDLAQDLLRAKADGR